mmetsp:Transcript_80261/g.126576  ORF Transcript_80261/g.126576 Transcript_80261/m.126576 type:complete len:448 (-) Transcript_80261:277-1620(-)
MKSYSTGHLVACVSTLVIANAAVYCGSDSSCSIADTEGCPHSASLLQRIDPRVVVRPPLPVELPSSTAFSHVGTVSRHALRADLRSEVLSGPVAMPQFASAVVKAKDDVRVAADAVANAADITRMAAKEASSVVRRPGVGLMDLKRVQENMKKAAKEQILASEKTEDAEKAEESLRPSSEIGEFLQKAASTELESKMKEAEALAQEADRLQTEALQANLVATEAQNEASVAEQAVTRAGEETVVCLWKMSKMCASTFEYMGVRYDSCVTDDGDSEAWCSHHSLYEGAWSRCSFKCEPRSKVLSVAQQTSKLTQAANNSSGSKALPAMSLLGIQKQAPGEEVDGSNAPLDEVGYTAIAELCDSAEMARFVRRLISAIGCRITDQNALVGFVPWYSGEADVQSYDKLNGELRCLCARGQGPPWIEPIDPSNPPAGGLLKCTGRRCDQDK